jgi:hypothetical protein
VHHRAARRPAALRRRAAGYGRARAAVGVGGGGVVTLATSMTK